MLMLFNDGEELSFGEISSRTSMEVAELKRTLQSLACGRER